MTIPEMLPYAAYRCTFGEVCVPAGTTDEDAVVAARLATSRRDARERAHLLTHYRYDDTLRLLVRRNKAGYALSARFCRWANV
jgi:hypothetical protein